ncbi:MAG TPA: serine/threonine-protein kinase [Pyrinomonadaceae bacterium]
MNPENWRKVEEVLDAALEIEPSQRKKFLAHIGADEIRREVESLLEGELEAAKFMDASAGAFSADFFNDEEVAPDALINQKIGNYKIVRELGRGGMGAVYLGERSDGKFSQQVAVKLLKRELNTADIRRRFARERQILAALAYPNIARLLDAGTTDDGLPFLVMEYVEGLPIDDFCDAHNLDLQERLQIFRVVCETVTFAHRNLIVHRDLKPSNILVTADAVPKLLDFGISKLLTPEFEAENAHTVTKLGAMTPEYASPEQLRGLSVTTATDVYSLGVILYELLTARRPFEFRKHSAEEIIRAVGETEPERPSSVVNFQSPESENIGTRRNKRPTTNNGRRTKSLKGDLDNIVLKALKKEPNRRYSSVEQFSEDIRRHLSNLPVLARPDTLSYRATKFINRNRLAVFAGLLIFLTLIGGIIATVRQSRRAEANQVRAEKRFNDVRKLSSELLFELSPKIERLPGSTEARRILVKHALEYLDSLSREAEGDLHLQSELASAYEKIGDLQGAPGKPNLSDFGGAIASLEKAQNIRAALLQKNPNDAENQKSLAANLGASSYCRWWMSDISGSIKDSERALALYEKLIAAEPDSGELRRSRAATRINLAQTYYFNDQVAEVYSPLQNALDELETLLRQSDADNAETGRLLGRARVLLGMNMFFDNRPAEGEIEIAKALELSEALDAKNPNDNVVKQGLWHVYIQSSQFYQESNPSRSFELLSKALKVVEESIKTDSADTQARQNLAKTYSMLGINSNYLKKSDAAVSYLEKSLAAFAELEKSEPNNLTYKDDIGRNLTQLGLTKYQQRDFAGALAAYAKAVEVFELQSADPKNLFPQRKLATVFGYTADAYRDLAKTGDRPERQKNQQKARENYRRALDIFLKLESQNALAEYDRRYLEEMQAALRKYE